MRTPKRHAFGIALLRVRAAGILAAALCLGGIEAPAGPLPPIKTVFLIVLENQRWDGILGSPSAPYINNVLLTNASYCTAYYNSPLVPHPSEPNYIWLESGTNFGIIGNGDPSQNHQSSTSHLATLLNNAGISWRSYQEDICGCEVPLVNTNLYAARHNPFVFFDDVSGTNNPAYEYGIKHVRPYSELAGDLAANTTARYNFITPNLCHDMHDFCPPSFDQIRQGDDWLALEIPKLLNSQSYQDGGAIFVTWDEPGISGYGPIGMLVLSPLAKGGGYASSVPVGHSSTLRTMQEIFGVGPFLGGADTAADLSDLFLPAGLSGRRLANSTAFQLTLAGPQTGAIQIVQVSTNLVDWTSILTNRAPTTNFVFTDSSAADEGQRFYRVLQRH